MDTDQMGICRVPVNAWLDGTETLEHDFAALILVAHPRLPEADNLARNWVESAQDHVTGLRAAEIAVCLSGHIRNMGWDARAHVPGHDRAAQPICPTTSWSRSNGWSVPPR